MNLRAHPFGPPMEASLTREGDRLVLSWTAAEDDWVVVGEASGAFAGAPTGRTGAEVLSDSVAVQDFLAGHLVLSQGGQECQREWLPTRDLLGEGVRAAFTCPEQGAPVTVRVDVLTDVNAAYRTVLRAGEQEVLFTASAVEHEVGTAGPAPEGGLGLGVMGGVLLAAAALVATAVAALRMRYRAGAEVAR